MKFIQELLNEAGYMKGPGDFQMGDLDNPNSPDYRPRKPTVNRRAYDQGIDDQGVGDMPEDDVDEDDPYDYYAKPEDDTHNLVARFHGANAEQRANAFANKYRSDLVNIVGVEPEEYNDGSQSFAVRMNVAKGAQLPPALSGKSDIDIKSMTESEELDASYLSEARGELRHLDVAAQKVWQARDLEAKKYVIKKEMIDKFLAKDKVDKLTAQVDGFTKADQVDKLAANLMQISHGDRVTK